LADYFLYTKNRWAKIRYNKRLALLSMIWIIKETDS